MKGRIHQLARRGRGRARRVPGRPRPSAEAGAPDPMGLGGRELRRRGRVDLIEAGLVDPAPWPIEVVDDPAKANVPDRPCGPALCRAGRARIEDRAAVAARGGVPAGSPMPDVLAQGRSKIRWCGGCSSPTPSRNDRRPIGTRRSTRSSATSVIEAAVIEALLAPPDGRRGRSTASPMLAYQTGRYDVGRAADREDRSAARPVGAGEARASSRRPGGGRARLDRGDEGQPEGRRC